VASAESGDDSIYNMSRPTTKIFVFSGSYSQREKIQFSLLVIFTRRKYFLNLSSKKYFSGSKKPTVQSWWSIIAFPISPV